MILYSHDKEYTKFLNKLYDSWCWRPPTYSQDTLHYFKDRVIEAGKTIEDRSFILLWENEPVIVFIGILIKSNDKIDLLAYEAPCITIEQEEKITTKAAKTFLKEFDRVSGALNGTIWYRGDHCSASDLGIGYRFGFTERV